MRIPFKKYRLMLNIPCADALINLLHHTADNFVLDVVQHTYTQQHSGDVKKIEIERN